MAKRRKRIIYIPNQKSSYFGLQFLDKEQEEKRIREDQKRSREFQKKEK